MYVPKCLVDEHHALLAGNQKNNPAADPSICFQEVCTCVVQ